MNILGRNQMSNYTYDDVLSRIQLLAPDDQLRLLEDLAAIVRQRITGEPLHSILELEGLVKRSGRVSTPRNMLIRREMHGVDSTSAWKASWSGHCTNNLLH